MSTAYPMRNILTNVPGATEQLASLTPAMIEALIDLRKGSIYQLKYNGAWKRVKSHRLDLPEPHDTRCISGLINRGLVRREGPKAWLTQLGDACAHIIYKQIIEMKI